MKRLRRLGLSVTLLCVLSLTALADDPNSSPCTPDPGSTNSPPCGAAQVLPGGSEIPGQTDATPASNSGAEYSIAEMAGDLFQSALLLF